MRVIRAQTALLIVLPLLSVLPLNARIRSLITQKIEKELPQSDVSADQPPPFVRNPQAAPYRDELAVNDVDQYFQGDVELSERQAARLEAQLLDDLGSRSAHSAGDVAKERTKRKVGRVRKRRRDRPTRVLRRWRCSSFVGRSGGTQQISIATPGCDTVGIIAHEVGHSLGLFHEQARPDQSDHITVHYNNIPISRWNNFYPVSSEQASIQGLHFDAGSVMMYGAYGFATNPYHPTLSTIESNWRQTIGQRAGPSFLDILAINNAYKCEESCPNPISCKNGGYVNPNDCSRCICPSGLGGSHCTEVQYSSCGAKIQASNQRITIETPNYPNLFPYNVDCIWLIEAAPGARLSIEFVEQFEYFCSEPCDNSFVELKLLRDFRPTGYRFCCSNLPPRLVSQGSKALIMHRSSGSLTPGFRAHIWADKPTVIPHTTTTRPSTVKPSPRTLAPAIRPSITTPSLHTKAEGLHNNTHNNNHDYNAVHNAAVDNYHHLRSVHGIRHVAGRVHANGDCGHREQPDWKRGDGDRKHAWILLHVPHLPPVVAALHRTSDRPRGRNELPFHRVIKTHPSSNVNLCLVDECSCGPWSDWVNLCSQPCGGCGRRTRKRACRAESCRSEEKRGCNFAVCPAGTNILLNNGEFHFLINGCCVGLFESGGQCTGLDQKKDPLLEFFVKILRPEDVNNATRSIPIPD
ncbi:Zinc metalloproteinase [Aphelenchoides fujianensis]|nr:Zinc metalloproteinase [Aphelenchoides fujianensis]